MVLLVQTSAKLDLMTATNLLQREKRQPRSEELI